jgi:division protein CdvB (Snf7/Vps24/ESCRT-III family)
MGYISKNWLEVKNSILSQKFLDRVRPEATLKNRIDGAGKKMDCQILRLEQTYNKLKQNHDNLFKKIVEAKQAHNESRARTYAIELQEIKKIKNKIAGAKLSMEQIKLRLGTVSELGDIVVTLSPCMSLIKGLAPSISGLFPQINTTMQDLPNMFEDILADSSLSTESMIQPCQGSTDTEAILNEAQHALEGRTRTTIPEAPVTTIENLSNEKETMI